MSILPSRGTRARRMLGCVLLAAIAALCAAAILGAFAFDVRIGEGRLNQAIQDRLPLDRHMGPIDVRLDRASLQVAADGRLDVSTRMHIAVGGRQVDGDVAGRARLSYADGSFWLSDCHVEKIEHALADISPAPAVAQAVPPRQDRPADRHLVLNVLRSLAGHHATLDARMAETEQKAILVAGNRADRMLDLAMSQIPVYRLQDHSMAESLTGLWLLSVHTDGHDLVAVLDPVGRTLSLVLGILGCAALALLLAAAFAHITSVDDAAPGSGVTGVMTSWL